MIDDRRRFAIAACAGASPLMVACDYDGTLSPLWMIRRTIVAIRQSRRA